MKLSFFRIRKNLPFFVQEISFVETFMGLAEFIFSSLSFHHNMSNFWRRKLQILIMKCVRIVKENHYFELLTETFKAGENKPINVTRAHIPERCCQLFWRVNLSYGRA